MEEKLIIIVGAPRSGTTLLARMLGAHSRVHAPAEPHVLTPLAHLGYYDAVQKAPYNHITSQLGIRALVASLPNGENDYLNALRAYTDTLYAAILSTTSADLLLDKTPEYALVLDFVTRLYPGARYVILTRHPMAIWASCIDSFFDGDHIVAHAHEPTLERYVPAIARFLRDRSVSLCHVSYEELVKAPAQQIRCICEFLDIPFEPRMIDYGEAGKQSRPARGLGDPMKVASEKRPTGAFVGKWLDGLSGRPDKVEHFRDVLGHLSDSDLEVWGYLRSDIEAQLSSVDPRGRRLGKPPLNRHVLERRLLVLLRRNIHTNRFGRGVRKVREICNVLLR